MNRKFRRQQKTAFIEPRLSKNDMIQAKFIFAVLEQAPEAPIDSLMIKFDVQSRKLQAKLYAHYWQLQSTFYRRQVILDLISHRSRQKEPLWHWWLYVRFEWSKTFPETTRLLEALELPAFQWRQMRTDFRQLDKTFSQYAAQLVKQPVTAQRAWQKSCASELIEQARKHFSRGRLEQILNPVYSPQNTIWVNRLKTSRKKILNLFRTQKIRAVASKICPDAIILLSRIPLRKLPFFEEGLFFYWDEARQLPLVLCDPHRFQTIYNVETGGGENLLGLAASQTEGKIFTGNVPGEAQSKVQEKIHHFGIQNVNWFQKDKLPATGFELVFLLQPGTQSGMIAEQPRLKTSFSVEAFHTRLHRQQQRLNEVAPLVKVGGILAYTTASYFPEENDDQIERFLTHHPDFEVQRINHSVLTNFPKACWTPYGFSTLPMIKKMKGVYLSLLKKNYT